MRFSIQRGESCLIFASLCAVSSCEASELGQRSDSVSNSTSTTFPNNEVAVTPTPIIISSSSTSSNYDSTITSAPVYPWGDQIIPINTCSVTASGGDIQYTPCQIFAGTVQMNYFPDNWGTWGDNTYTEYYNADFGVTMTSPSIYMKVNTITGENDCGPLGPTYVDKVVSMDLTEVSTLQPYADHTVTTRMGPPQQLILSDLTSNCQETYGTFSTDGAFVNTHPVSGMYNRCHPRFVFPIEIKRLGYPYWMHCGNANYTYGIFDPPGAIPPVSGLLPTTAAEPYTSTYESASALPTALPVQETSQAAPPVASTTPPADPAAPPPPPPPAPIPTSKTPPTDPAVSPPPPASIPTSKTLPTAPAISPPPPASIPTSATAIATVGSQTISAIPGSSGVVLPNGSTAKPGSVATITDSNNKPVVVSVGSSGVFIGGTSQGDSTSFFANPTLPPAPPRPTSTAIAVIGGQTISAAPGDSTLVIDDQTITSGGSAVTLAGSNNVVSIGSSGVVVKFPGGTVSTFTLPTATPDWVTTTVDSMTVSASAGASVVLVGNQAVTSGGSAVTVGNDVVSLGTNGLEVMMPGGRVTTVSFASKAEASTAAGVITSSNALGSIIASMAGENQPDKAIGSPSSTNSAVGLPAAVANGGSCGITVRREVAWWSLTFFAALKLVFGQ